MHHTPDTSACPPLPGPPSYLQIVEGFYRANETAEGIWACRRGTVLVDTHASLNDALAHLVELAGEEPAPAYIYAHWLNGRVELMGEHGGA